MLVLAGLMSRCGAQARGTVVTEDVTRATPCTAGITVVCPCVGGGQGVQTCDSTTGTFDACICASADGGALDGATFDGATLDRVATDDGPRPDLGVDGAPPDGPRPPPETFAYVISAITIDQEPGGGAPNPATSTRGVSGFNLDNLTSTTADAAMRGGAACSHADFFSTLDPDQNMGACAAGSARGGAGCLGGVDNQLPEAANTVMGFGADVRASLTDSVRRGLSAVVVRVSDVNGVPGPALNDDAVRVDVYPVARPMFASCSLIGTPGQTFAIDDASLTAPGDLNSARLSYAGSIVNGRLRVAPPTSPSAATFPFGLPLMGTNLSIPLLATQLRFDMTPDRGTGGNLGGYVRLAPLASMLGALLPAGIPVSTVQAVLQALVDVQDPAGSATGCTAPNGGISMAFGFDAVRVQLAATTVRGPQAGTCGGSP